MMGLGSIPALLALPVVLVLSVAGIQTGLLGNREPIGIVMLATVVGVFVSVGVAIWMVVAFGEGALRRARGLSELAWLGSDASWSGRR